ncbi:MAG: putative quinol monooxygenase [Rhodospirillaceae bacterium]
MQRFAIVVTIKLNPGYKDTFREMILKNATASVGTEDECHLFHVLEDQENPDTFVFYEIYSSPEALEHHREQSHFKNFFEGATEMVADRQVRRVTVVNPTNFAPTLGG